MVNSIEDLNEEWGNIRLKMKNNRREFDDIWRDKHKEHNCNSIVYAENGEWFCEHLTRARNNHFKKESQRIEEIICCLIS